MRNSFDLFQQSPARNLAIAGGEPAEAGRADICEKYNVGAVVVQVDVSNEADVANLFQETIKHFRQVDIVMSNAGIEHFGDLDKATGEDIDKVSAVNVKGQFFVAQHAGKHMAPNGRRILMSSISSLAQVSSGRRPAQRRRD
ncbi:NAD(P)-binding protein [Trichocladium antarcticum]|uniref:NAD(P)-binding protein n=1 Tax=Trichocladium antarcticum TaxID=1450529 RepID=A0AAN6UMQ4_9PEZI|nr:NAD(P)-binding protein [Trichocladium antarcticum]